MSRKRPSGGRPGRGDPRRGPRAGGGGRGAGRSPGKGPPGDRLVVGRHPVADALRYQPERAERLILLDEGGPLAELEKAAREAGVEVGRVSRDELDALAGPGLQHQGAVLTCGPFPFVELADAAAEATLVLALDSVEDPRNLGAAARAGLALGADLLLIPRRRAAGPTASAHKAAAGALSRLPVCQVENLRRALDTLKAAGLWAVAAEADGAEAPWQVDFTERTVLVIGGEDAGVRRLVREGCDRTVAVPMAADGVTLNAADAATVLLYEAHRQRAVAG